MMAAAVYAGSGRMAVALGEMGPGGLNLAAGEGVAFNNNLPLLAVTTNQHRAAAYPHSGMFMDLDTRAVLAPLTKWNAVVHDPRRIPELVRRAFREALSGRPGPVHLDIPQDVLAAPCEFARRRVRRAPARYRATARTASRSRNSCDAAAELLRGRERPLIVAGGGVVAAQAQRGAARDSRDCCGRRWCRRRWRSAWSRATAPHFIGHGGLIAGEPVMQAFEQADVILSVGCRYSSWMWDEHGPLCAAGTAVININIDPSALGAPVLHEVAHARRCPPRAHRSDRGAWAGSRRGRAGMAGSTARACASSMSDARGHGRGRSSDPDARHASGRAGAGDRPGAAG